MKIEIVSHCWSEKHPCFAGALCCQLSSLVTHEPENCAYHITVCCDPNDKRTQEVLDFFIDNGFDHLAVSKMFLPPEKLGRRAIGRNLAAKDTNADLVWFTDCDHVFLGCLDALAALEWPQGASMIFPRELQIHSRHAYGDALLKELEGWPRIVDLDTDQFRPKPYHRAIGGVQIVQGDFARRHGYLDGNEKWQRPVEVPFGNFRDDIAYRKFCLQHGKIVRVDLSGLYRVRHTYRSYHR